MKRIMELLHQVNMVHHVIRPDLFKPHTTKYSDEELEAILNDDSNPIFVYDDGNAYYIVQVLEAAKDSKLRNSSASNYATTRGQEFMDSVVDEIAKLVGSTGSYSTLSKNHWLEKMDLLYHDQEVYDYFESNYPDLFED